MAAHTRVLLSHSLDLIESSCCQKKKTSDSGYCFSPGMEGFDGGTEGNGGEDIQHEKHLAAGQIHNTAAAKEKEPLPKGLPMFRLSKSLSAFTASPSFPSVVPQLPLVPNDAPLTSATTSSDVKFLSVNTGAVVTVRL